MRHRADYFDIDLKEATDRFDTNLAAKAKKGFAKVGYAAMRGADTLVATIAWKAKYQQAMEELLRTSRSAKPPWRRWPGQMTSWPGLRARPALST